MEKDSCRGHRMHATMTACRDISYTLRLQTLPPRHHPWDFIADYEEGAAVSSLPAQAYGRSYLNLSLSVAMAGLMRSCGRCVCTGLTAGRTFWPQASLRRRFACTDRLILALETWVRGITCRLVLGAPIRIRSCLSFHIYPQITLAGGLYYTREILMATTPPSLIYTIKKRRNWKYFTPKKIIPT
jgi:hypothetical protein